MGLTDAWKKWNAELMPPRWTPPRPRSRRQPKMHHEKLAHRVIRSLVGRSRPGRSCRLAWSPQFSEKSHDSDREPRSRRRFCRDAIFYDSGGIGEAHVYKAQERAVSRHWHPNGVLASEKTIQSGIIEGVASYWNDRGELVDSFEIRNGSGVWRIWELDARSRWYRNIECRTINNMKIGRQLEYSDHGTTAIETYWINDKKISKKRYFKACEHDPNLPRYDWEPPVPPPPPKEPRPPAKVSDDLRSSC